MIAMAVVNRPSLLIADEPTTALDVTIQAQVLDLLSELREKFSLAMLFISHDLAVVSQVSHRIGVMYAGSLVEMGTAQGSFRASGASVHARAVTLGADAAQRAQPAAADHRGNCACHHRTAAGLRLRAALLVAHCKLFHRRCRRWWKLRPAIWHVVPWYRRRSAERCGCCCSATFTPTWRRWRHVSRSRRRMICLVNLGDVVGYNASPNEVCERVRAMGGSIVRGNHDRACSGLIDLSEFNLVAAMSARWTQTDACCRTSGLAAHLAARTAARRRAAGSRIRARLATRRRRVRAEPVDRRGEPSHARSRRTRFSSATHICKADSLLTDGRVRNFAPIFPTGEDVVEFTMPLTRSERYLINPGSVGQPRDGDWRAAFALYERNGEAPGAVTFYRVPYDVDADAATNHRC